MPRVYAYFQCRKGWHVQFHESDLRTPLRKQLTFAHEHKVVELAERGGADLNPDTRSDLQHGIEIGRGGFYLNLTDEQYLRLF